MKWLLYLQFNEDAYRFLDVKLINVNDFLELVLRFVFNFLIGYVIIKLIYHRNHRTTPEYTFSYFVFHSLIFFVCYLMSSTTLEIGFAFGLFAVFSIIRYRTTTIEIREMTYLFVVIGVSVMNAISTKRISYAELIFTNFTVIAVLYFFDKMIFRRSAAFEDGKELSEQMVTYEKIELVKPARREELLEDLRDRTGLDVINITVEEIDFLRDTALLKVFHR